MSLAYRLAAATGAVRRAAYRTRRLSGRARHAYDLWYRLGFPWDQAWRIAGTWN